MLEKISIYEKINFFNFIYIIFFKKKNYYLTTNIFSIILKYIFPKKVNSIDINKFDNTDKNNISVRYMVEHFNSNILNLLRKEKLCIKDKNFIKYGSTWENTILSWVHYKFFAKTEKVIVISNYFEKKLDKNYSLDFYIDNFFMFNFWKKHFLNKKKIKIHKNNFFFFDPFPKRLLELLYRLFISIFYIRNEKRNKNYNIYIQAMDGLLSKFPFAGHLFWFKESKISSKKIYIFQDHPSQEIKDKKILNRYKFNLIKIKKYKIRFSIPNIINQLRSIKFLNNYNFGIFFVKIHCLLTIMYYRYIFREYGIKICTHHFEPVGHIPLCMFIAAEEEKVLMITNHWSVSEHFYSHYQLGITDVFLHWGIYDNLITSQSGFRSKMKLYSGLVDGDNLNYKKLKLKKKIHRKKKITLFDSTHGEFSRDNLTSQVYGFYMSFLNLTDRRNDIHLFIKPKAWSLIRLKNKYKDLKKLISKLEKQKKITIINSKESCIKVATSSDFSVCYNINTAGVLSEMADKTCFFFDSNKLKFSFFKNSNYFEQNNLFSDVSNLINKIEFLLDKNLQKNLTLKKKFIFNHYNDSYSNIRVGQFIYQYMTKLKKYSDKSKLIEIASKHYKKNFKNKLKERYKDEIKISSILKNLKKRQINYVKMYMKKNYGSKFI